MDQDLADLMAAWLGGATDRARLEELAARLRSDEGFRRRFVDEIRMLGMLKIVQSPEPRWLRLEDELGWSAAGPASSKALEDRIVSRIDGPPPRRPRISRTARRWAFAASAALLASSLGLGLAFRPRPTVEVPAVSTARPYPRVDTSTGLAMVVKLEGVDWEPSIDPRPTEGDVLAPGRLQFRSGRAILSMLTGVVLDVEGPADIELVADNKVLCHRGRIRARVPAGAEGFLVFGPSAAVVDLGTEFGLNVGLDGKMRGQIFKGKLEAALLNASGSPQRSYTLDAAKANANKAFELDSRSGRIDAVATSEDFVRPSDLDAPPLPLDPGYPEAILRARPWGYWRFESMAEGLVKNERPGRPPLRATGAVRLAEALGGNRCAEFPAVEGRSFLEMAEPWHPTWEPGFAVEFWCLPGSIAHASLVSLTTPVETDHNVFLMELTSRNRLTIHKPAAFRLLHRWPAGWEGGDNMYSQEPYVPYRWHHVVGQVSDDRMQLFTDGVPSTPLSITPGHSDVACQFLLGRLSTLEGSGISVDRPFVGRIDEVAVYDRPLTPDEIRAHHRMGARTPRPR